MYLIHIKEGYNLHIQLCFGLDNPKDDLTMKPLITDTSFGSITVGGKRFDHDIMITLEGEVRKRKKKLSKAVYGTSHKISLNEIEYVYQRRAEGIIFGSGQYGIARLSEDATRFLMNNNCRFSMSATPEAVQEWNRTEGSWIGLFHITC